MNHDGRIGEVVTTPRMYLFKIFSTTKRGLRFALTAKILHRSTAGPSVSCPPSLFMEERQMGAKHYVDG